MITVIPIESFFDPSQVMLFWPKNIRIDSAFASQVNRRRDLIRQLDGLINCLPRPDTPIVTAIEKGFVSEKQAAVLYESLTDLLDDADYKRLVLYFPFEFLPHKTWKPQRKKLQQALNKFRMAYMNAWRNLLSVHDVRANFVDGDVSESEVEFGNAPRVVKVAHLIPKLVEKSLLTAQAAIELMETSDDAVLKNSIADALPVLGDMGLLTEEEIRLMESSKDQLVRNMARISASQRKTKSRAFFTAFPTDEIDDSGITEKRKTWLKQNRQHEKLERMAEKVAISITNDAFEVSAVGIKLDALSQHVMIEGIRTAVELTAARRAEQRSKALYLKYRKYLLEFWQIGDEETKELIARALRRLYKLGVASKKELANLGITFPYLAGPFVKNLKLMSREMACIEGIIAAIQSDNELSKMLYPVAAIFGSRLHGYGNKNSDIDFCIFVKPEIDFNERPKIKEIFGKIIPPDCGICVQELFECWLRKENGYSTVKEFTNSDIHLIERDWTHILFGGCWTGNELAVRELFERLLVPYYFDTSELIKGRESRGLYLETMEKSALQYRLMHKGYQNFFPEFGGINTANSDAIDSKSMFWDSGYRQLATRLFISRVFLPKIKIQKRE